MDSQKLLKKAGEVASKVGAVAQDTFKTVSNKANDVMETQKLKSKISAAKKSIEEIKIQIGELVWKTFTEDGALSDELKALCESIKEHNAEIEATEAVLEENKAAKEAAKAEKEAAKAAAKAEKEAAKAAAKEEKEAEEATEETEDKE